MADLLLGELVDPAQHARTGTKVALPSGDLTTHGVIVGMTGSGKTGLGVVLIEEALAAGIPALLIDPKGDLGNLCLTFPGLSGPDFRPWVNEGDAQKAGVTVDEFALQQANAWKDGLAGWGIGPERIASLRQAVGFTIYTPGSTAGVPLNIVGSLQAPENTADVETMRDEIEGYVSGLLGLVGIEADPLSSREHILLSNLVETSWIAGKSLDLPTVLAQVQTPPMRKLGVFELDSFFPPADRTALAMKLNGLLASPSFAAWSAGPSLDMDQLLRMPDGHARAAIVTTAHLSDEERQFVTALVLAKLVTWMRRQSGTTDLRALLYMDEVAGYLPPTANPPTKKPIMTLMKQARAFGVGVVLSTQNPVDIDYKAISNAGTWMIGRLQTERDKARLLDGMSAATGGVDVKAVGDTIAGLAKREFVLRRAGKDAPEVFTTRWAMSYLRGPLTRDQIELLMADQREAPGTRPETPAAQGGSEVGALDETTVMPDVASGIAVRYVDPAAPWLAATGGDPRGTSLEPAVIARVRLRYDEEKADLVVDEEYEAILFPLDASVDVTRAVAVDYDDRDLRAEPVGATTFRLSDAPLKEKTFWSRLERDLVDHLVRSRPLELQVNRPLKLYSRPGETAEAFATRCAQAADDHADAEVATLRDKYEAKAKKLGDQIATAANRVEVLESDKQGRRSEELLGTAGSILGGLLGGRRSSRSMAGKVLGSLGGIAGRRTRSRSTGERLESAQEKVASLQEDLEELEGELAETVTEIQAAWQAKAAEVTTTPVSLERTDVSVAQLVLAWVPVP
ncbi:MAG: ATP-binding protein [Acidimicrobiia bacterium]